VKLGRRSGIKHSTKRQFRISLFLGKFEFFIHEFSLVKFYFNILFHRNCITSKSALKFTNYWGKFAVKTNVNTIFIGLGQFPTQTKKLKPKGVPEGTINAECCN